MSTLGTALDYDEALNNAPHTGARAPELPPHDPCESRIAARRNERRRLGLPHIMAPRFAPAPGASSVVQNAWKRDLASAEREDAINGPCNTCNRAAGERCIEPAEVCLACEAYAKGQRSTRLHICTPPGSPDFCASRIGLAVASRVAALAVECPSCAGKGTGVHRPRRAPGEIGWPCDGARAVAALRESERKALDKAAVELQELRGVTSPADVRPLCGRVERCEGCGCTEPAVSAVAGEEPTCAS